MSERIRHRNFQMVPDSEIRGTDSWYIKHREGITNTVFVQDDIRFSRYLIASFLVEASNRKAFFEENSYLEPAPTELDRMLMIAYLQALASASCLINAEEILEIQAKEGKVPLENFAPREPRLESFEELAVLAREWRTGGLTVGLFHGSFDPPTVMHLSCAADAYRHCDRLIIGFDSDELVRSRKGETRPRFSLDQRRQIFSSFWMVDGSVVLRATSVDDIDAYVADYASLSISRVFLASNQEDREARLRKIRKSGAEPFYLPPRTPGPFSSTRVLELIQEREREFGK